MSLKKEIVLAITIGALLGAIVALLITQTPQKLLTKKPQISPTPPETPAITPEIAPSLEILLPENQALVQEEKVTVSGKTVPEATVILTSSLSEEVTVASTDGTFSAEISLEEGANEITVVTLANGEELEKTLIVNYTKEEL